MREVCSHPFRNTTAGTFSECGLLQKPPGPVSVAARWARICWGMGRYEKGVVYYCKSVTVAHLAANQLGGQVCAHLVERHAAGLRASHPRDVLYCTSARSKHLRTLIFGGQIGAHLVGRGAARLQGGQVRPAAGVPVAPRVTCLLAHKKTV